MKPLKLPYCFPDVLVVPGAVASLTSLLSQEQWIIRHLTAIYRCFRWTAHTCLVCYATRLSHSIHNTPMGVQPTRNNCIKRQICRRHFYTYDYIDNIRFNSCNFRYSPFLEFSPLDKKTNVRTTPCAQEHACTMLATDIVLANNFDVTVDTFRENHVCIELFDIFLCKFKD